MNRSLPLALGMSLLLTSPVTAEVLEVALVGAEGTFGPGPQVRTGIAELPASPVQIHSVSLRVAGEVTVGSLDCPDGPQGWGITWGGGLFDPATGGLWVTRGPAAFVPPQPVAAGMIGVTVPFDITLLFEPFQIEPFPEEPSWALLDDLVVELGLNGNPSGYLSSCTMGPHATGVVTGAWLVIDGAFTIPVVEESWSALRARYR